MVFCAWGRKGWIYAHLPLGLKRLNNQMMIRSSIYAFLLLMWMHVCVQLCVCLLSHVWLFATLGTVTPQAPLSMEFSRQEYWSGLPLQGIFLIQWLKLHLLSLLHWPVDSISWCYLGSPLVTLRKCYIYVISHLFKTTLCLLAKPGKAWAPFASNVSWSTKPVKVSHWTYEIFS